MTNGTPPYGPYVWINPPAALLEAAAKVHEACNEYTALLSALQSECSHRVIIERGAHTNDRMRVCEECGLEERRHDYSTPFKALTGRAYHSTDEVEIFRLFRGLWTITQPFNNAARSER